jgi:hypothetical protein
MTMLAVAVYRFGISRLIDSVATTATKHASATTRQRRLK